MVNVTRLLPALAAAALAITFAPGCSDDTPATPQAAVTSTIRPGSGGAQACSTNQSVYWAIGNGSGGDIPVKDGDTMNGANVGVQCKVSGNDQAGYDVAATAALAGKGSIAIHGHFTSVHTTQTSISATFNDSSGLGSFVQSDCTATYEGDNQGVAGGRIWATLTCPSASDTSKNKVCEGDSVFRFENCSQ
jgi:hypothetical protein